MRETEKSRCGASWELRVDRLHVAQHRYRERSSSAHCLTRVNQFSYIIRQSRLAKSHYFYFILFIFHLAMLFCVTFCTRRLSPLRLSSRFLEERFTCFNVGPVSLSTRKVIISFAWRPNSTIQCKKSLSPSRLQSFSFLHHHHVALLIWWQSRWIYSAAARNVELEIALNLSQAKVSVDSCACDFTLCVFYEPVPVLSCCWLSIC